MHGLSVQWSRDNRTMEFSREPETPRACGGGPASSSDPAPQPPCSRDQTGYVNETMPDLQVWDASGFIWGRAGHYPLYVHLGYGRNKSASGVAESNIAKSKKRWWTQNGKKSWPWWTAHESEKYYWLPGGQSSGRGFSGSRYILY